MTEQLLDVKRVVRLIWRHRRLTALFVVVGLLASIGLVVIRPTLYSASSLVLLPGAAGTNGQTVGNDMSTDSQIATSSDILGPAGKQIDPSLSLASLRQRVHAVGTATNVLQITASGETPKQAEDLANLVATNLVRFVTTNGSATNASGLAALQSEAAQLTKQINDVNAEISSTTKQISEVGASSSSGQADTALLASLTAQQSQSTLQLDSLNSQIAQAQLGTSAANAGTEVIQRAKTASAPSILGVFLVVVLGGVIGLTAGSVLVVLRYRGDPRLRRRDQIAEAVGVPVVLSLTTTRRKRGSEWTEFFGRYHPSSNERWRVRKALHDLGLGEGASGTLLVLSLGGDDASLTVAPQLALSAITLGISVSLNVVGKDHHAMDLRAAVKRLAVSGQGPSLKTGVNRAGLTIVPMVVDSTRPEVAGKQAAVTVMAVSAGYATVEELARVAIAATDSHQPVGAIVVTNPDPDDLTTGRIVDAVSQSVLLPYRRPLHAGRV